MPHPLMDFVFVRFNSLLADLLIAQEADIIVHLGVGTTVADINTRVEDLEECDLLDYDPFLCEEPTKVMNDDGTVSVNLGLVTFDFGDAPDEDFVGKYVWVTFESDEIEETVIGVFALPVPFAFNAITPKLSFELTIPFGGLDAEEVIDNE